MENWHKVEGLNGMSPRKAARKLSNRAGKAIKHILEADFADDDKIESKGGRIGKKRNNQKRLLWILKKMDELGLPLTFADDYFEKKPKRFRMRLESRIVSTADQTPNRRRR